MGIGSSRQVQIMAMISGKKPQPPQPSIPTLSRRVVVKFQPTVQLPYSEEAATRLDGPASVRWRNLQSEHSGITLVPYFSTLDEGTLRRLAERTPRVKSLAMPNVFTQYYAVRVQPGTDPEAVARAIAGWPDVQIAYVEGGPVPPPVDPGNDPRSSDEGYLNAAPQGLNARYGWDFTDGRGIGFVDLERGWTLNHEDLAAAGVSVISGVNQDFPGHGTAVLGEVLAVDNSIGCIGLAPNVHARVVSQWRTASDYNTAEAILSAASVMTAGDVLQLEAQTVYPGYTNVPVEVEQATFDAIRFAVSQGIIVVEAGGNGSNDLDSFRDTNGKNILNRASADFQDSGAILVGAASSAAPHSRLDFSNYGSRIDCFAWGQNITTCGDGWTGNATNTYTSGFGGTSGATPMVTGSALLVQSWRVGDGLSRHDPAGMRSTLSHSGNTASAAPASDRIGVMPDLKAIFARERRARWPLYVAWAWLLLIGGLLITPGGVFCIRCGPANLGFIGDGPVILLGLASIALGIAGFVFSVRTVARGTVEG
jgi:hypothetical protein